MHIRVGCEFRYEETWPTPAVIQVQPRRDGAHRVLQETWQTVPELPVQTFYDIYGNTCQRLLMAIGEQVFRYDALVEVSAEPDEFAPDAIMMPGGELPY